MPSQASSNLATTVGQNIKAARESAGLTQRALAEKLDTDPMLVSKWERGKHRPQDERLMLIAEITGREVAWFYSGVDRRGHERRTGGDRRAA